MGNIKSFGVVCALTLLVVPHFAYAKKNDSTWKVSAKKEIRLNKQAKGLPQKRLFDLDLSTLENTLRSAPKRFSGSSSKKAPTQISNTTISIPKANGKQRNFRIYENSVMAPELAAKYPEIKSYYGVGIEDPASRTYFTNSPLGFNSMTITPGEEPEFIEPVSDDLQTYTVYKKSETSETDLKITEPSSASTTTTTKSLTDSFLGLFQSRTEETTIANSSVENFGTGANDGYLRTYRLAITANAEYSMYFGGTKALALAAITNTITLVNGVFESDFGVRFILVANNDAVIFIGDPASDPYTPYAGGSASNWVGEAQSTFDALIGPANYDIGHFFAGASQSGFGQAGGGFCPDSKSKGSGYSGAGSNGSAGTTNDTGKGNVDLVVVAHELAHQLGAHHTFLTVEPGNGTTIMGYGYSYIQGAQHPYYFNAMNIQEVTNRIKQNPDCGTLTATGNAIPVVDAGPDYTIPKSTPFVLRGSATDADAGDTLVYNWEELDFRNSSGTYTSASTSGPLFRSFPPSASPVRYFPNMETVLAGLMANPNGGLGAGIEILPSVVRDLNFRLTVRDHHVGGPATNSDDVLLTVTDAAGPFVVTAPNAAVTYPAGSTQTITWDVAGTTGNGVNTANVDILLSTDGGKTFPITLASATPNDGSASILIPNSIGSMNRIMIRGVNHIFFDVSDTNFAISSATGDSVIPIAPTLAASGTTSSATTLSWSGATDNVGVTGYDIYQNDVLKASTTASSLSITGLSSSTAYKFYVVAKDAAGNRSFASNAVAVTTLALITDTTAPTAPTLSATGTIPTATNLFWSGATDNVGVVRYRVYQNGTLSSFGEVTALGKVMTNLTPGATYSFYVKAYDAAGNASPASNTISVTTPATDTIAPTKAPILSVVDKTKTSITLSWTRSADNLTVGYSLYKDGVLATCGYSNSSDCPVTGLTAATTYSFYVVAKDAAGNSITGNTITVATSSDITPPTAPTLSASGATSSSVNLSWSGATDNIGVTGYMVSYRASGTSSSQSQNAIAGTGTTVSGLAPSTAYSFNVYARDAAGNSSPSSNYVTVTTLPSSDITPPTAPIGLMVQSVTATSVNFGFIASSDAVGVVGYDIYQNGVFKTSMNSTTGQFQATGLSPITTYTFYIVAKDLAGNRSQPSKAITVTTLATDMAPPTAPTLIAWAVSSSRVELHWSGATDDMGVTKYDLYMNGALYVSTANSEYMPSLTPSSTSTFYVIARDATLKSSPPSNTVTVSAPAASADTISPSMQSSFTAGLFTASGTTSSSTILSWPAGTDNVGVTRYDIYQNGVPKLSTPSTSVTITGLTASTAYSFRLVARDAAGNSSYYSQASVTTLASGGGDTIAPTAPSLSATGTTASSMNLSWSGSSDNVGVSGYDVYQNGVLKTSTSSSSLAVSGLSSSTSYSFYVIAKDAAGNRSAASNTVSVTTSAAADTTAPSAPTLTASGATASSTNLYWSGAADAVGVTGYDIYQNGVLRNSSNGTNASITGLSASTTYSFYVIAKDAAGNRSLASNTVSVTTLAVADTSAPSAPSLAASGTTTSSTNLSWSGSTDNVGVVGYDVYQNGVLKTSTSSTSLAVSGLSSSTSYSFYVIAKDAAGNRSLASNTVSVTTSAAADTTAPSAATLTASGVTSSSTNLFWSGATDAVGVTGYDIYQNGVLKNSSNGTNASITGLSASTTYTFYVIAKDAAGNRSAASNTVSITTLEPIVVGSSLTVTLTVPVTVTRRSIATFSATASVTSGTISRVEFYVAGSLVCTDTTAAYSCSWKAPGSAKTVTVEARAYDGTGSQKSAFQTMQITR